MATAATATNALEDDKAASPDASPWPSRTALGVLTLALTPRWEQEPPDGDTHTRDVPFVALLCARDALRYPHRDPGEDQRTCEAALRRLVTAFVRVYTESDDLDAAEIAAIWEAQGFLDGIDEAAARADARACHAAAQRERGRGRRNRDRQRREERATA